jgi:hypothetical protein
MSKAYARADKDSPWSSKKAVSSTKLSSSLANAKGDLFLSPEATCIVLLGSAVVVDVNVDDRHARTGP